MKKKRRAKIDERMIIATGLSKLIADLIDKGIFPDYSAYIICGIARQILKKEILASRFEALMKEMETIQ